MIDPVIKALFDEVQPRGPIVRGPLLPTSAEIVAGGTTAKLMRNRLEETGESAT